MNNNRFPSSTFVAVDIEYADREQNICQIGLVVVRNQEIVNKYSWFIQPPGNHYEENMILVHNVKPEDTSNHPTFIELWPEIQPYFLLGELWAHNAVSTEQPVLVKNLNKYGLNSDFLSIHDSRDLFQRPDCTPNKGNSLPLCCMAMGIKCENHHNALADAYMCAQLLILLQQGHKPKWDGVPTSDEQLRKTQQEKKTLHLGEFQSYYANGEADGKDAFAEMTSTYNGAQAQVIDVFDKGDKITEGITTGVDFSRLDTSEHNPLFGKKVVVTGLFRIKRKEIEQAIDLMGAKRVPKPTLNTDAVILGTKNVGFTKLCAIEEQQNKGHHMAIIVGDTDLNALLYGDGHKFFGVAPDVQDFGTNGNESVVKKEFPTEIKHVADSVSVISTENNSHNDIVERNVRIVEMETQLTSKQPAEPEPTIYVDSKAIEIERLRAENAALQARIDMLKFGEQQFAEEQQQKSDRHKHKTEERHQQHEHIEQPQCQNKEKRNPISSRKNDSSQKQLTGESYLNSRREHWRKEIEKDPGLRKNKEQNRLRREKEKEQEEQKEQELSLWHWRAVSICIALVVVFFIIAFLAGKYHFDFIYALFPMVPAIGVIIWGDQMKEILSAGKDPWIELIKMIIFSVLALVLIYFSFIFIVAILLLPKILKMR